MGKLMSCWVECSETYCKASYVIEGGEGEVGKEGKPDLSRHSHTLSNAFLGSTPLLLLP